MNPIESVPRSAVDAAPEPRASFASRVPAIAQWFAVASLALSVATAAYNWRLAHALEVEALEPAGGSACPGAVVDYTFAGYDGPVGIVGACVAVFRYTGGRMTIVAYDAAADGIYRNGFDTLDPEG